MATMLHQTARPDGRTWPTLDVVEDAVREARTAIAGARHAAQEAAEHLELAARRRPLAAVSVATAAGFVAGGVVAFVLGWFTARRFNR